MEYYCDVIIKVNDKVIRCYRGEHAKPVTVYEDNDGSRHKKIYDYFQELFGGKPFRILKIKARGR